MFVGWYLEFQDKSEFDKVMARNSAEIEIVLRGLKKPSSRVAIFYRNALATWRAGLQTTGLSEEEALGEEASALWLIVSALVSLQQEGQFALSAKQAYHLAGTSRGDGRRKLRLAEDLELIEWQNPLVGKRVNRKVKLCCPTKLAITLYRKQVDALTRGFGISLSETHPGLQPHLVKQGVLPASTRSNDNFLIPPETRG